MEWVNKIKKLVEAHDDDTSNVGYVDVVELLYKHRHRLIEIVIEAEWLRDIESPDSNVYFPFCSICGNLEMEGHEPTCPYQR